MIDPAAFNVTVFEDDAYFRDINIRNYFSMLLVIKGEGILIADVSEYPFSEKSLMCFSLYQRFKIKSDGEFKGVLINFHPDFFCLHKHRNEVSCNGILFNNIYDSPITNLQPAEMGSLTGIAHQLQSEALHPALAQYEVLLSYLKIFLINASRIKMEQREMEKRQMELLETEGRGTGKEPVILSALKEAIEAHFKTLHRPGDYAGLLHISAKALNKAGKARFNKTLSDLIAERIIIEAKRELYLTSKPVKQIAFELGFNDEFYFSRYFKNNVGVSPQVFRDTVGFDKANA
jgi:AraC family transcriptional regulator, transcriptional activator of pobA